MEAEFDIRWGIGIDEATDLLDVAEACGVIEKSGAYYAFGGKNFANGRDKARDAVLGDPNLRAALFAETCAALPSLARRNDAKAA
jgi:recombination protein RecA